MASSLFRWFSFVSLIALLVSGGCDSCGSTPIDKTDGAIDMDAGDGGEDAGEDGGEDAGDAGPDVDVGDVCGDGILGITEACDDGNTEDGDGCAADCQSIETDWLCPVAGAACYEVECGDQKIEGDETCDSPGEGCDENCQLVDGWVCPIPGLRCQAAECGDGIVAGNEQCDEGEAADGVGCTENCQIEEGWHCPIAGEPCEPTKCGDGIRQGLEQCDDWNEELGEEDLPFDGCYQCKLEPNCSGGTCVAICGDGVLFGVGEQCDDGNTRDGDGCSSTCELEEGFTCDLVTEALPDTIELPVIYRDFFSENLFGEDGDPEEAHTDFNEDGAWGNAICFGIPQNTLNAQGRPVLNEGYTCPMETDDGIVDAPAGPENAASFAEWYTENPKNKRVISTITLTRSGTSYGFDSEDGPELERGLYPLDGLGWNHPDSVPREPLADSDKVIQEGDDDNPTIYVQHNFGFTTETHYWFEYGGDEVLEFSGDDDLWVFVDGFLCLDVGGLHPRMEGTLSFANPATDADQQAIVQACKDRLVVGNVYEMVIFHAERHTNASNFKLTLTNFEKRRSVCSSVCGDDHVTPDEVCDLGAGQNNGGYNGCNADCLSWGPRCGDGELQDEHEECDDGRQNLGQYGGCRPDCTLGPRCGDGVRQPLHEQCDDGENNGAPGSFCNENCTLRFIGPG